MALLSEKDREKVRERLEKGLVGDVQVSLFTQTEERLVVPGVECPQCRETRQLLEEIAELSDKIHLHIYDFLADAALAKENQVDKIPAILIQGEQAGIIRYFGLPDGYEFLVLLDGLIDASRAATDLAEDTKAELAKLEADIHLQVFV